MSREGALWVGGLESYMDEPFIQRALQLMGEAPPLSIKVMKNKFSEAAAGYGFINYQNDQVALTVMHKLNGKMMPNTNPPVRWKLNHSSNRLLPGEKNHSVWVGDLTPEVPTHHHHANLTSPITYSWVSSSCLWPRSTTCSCTSSSPSASSPWSQPKVGGSPAPCLLITFRCKYDTCPSPPLFQASYFP